MSRWTERIVVGVIVLGIAVACDPLATNNVTTVVAAISDLRIPSPSVVIGDVMRDSLGTPAALSLTAFAPDGRVLSNQSIFVTVLDPSLHVDDFGFVHGLIRDTVGARVIAGAGDLQTPQSRIFVTIKPDVVTKGVSPTSITFDTTAKDTTAQTNWSPPLVMTETDALLATGAQGFIVTYTVTRSPKPLTAGVPTVYIADDNGRASSRDTTDFNGVASRRVVLRQTAVNDSALMVAGTKTDTITVRATALYLGTNISGSPVDFIIPIKRKP